LTASALQRAAYNRLARIGGVELAVSDRVSFDAIVNANHSAFGGIFPLLWWVSVGRLSLAAREPIRLPVCL